MSQPTEAEIGRAADAALRGELIVVPTDTVYGIGTRPDDPSATARVFDAKLRPRDLELPVLIPSFESGERIAEIDDRARRLADRFWPGPLTIVLRRSASSVRWELGGDPSTIGLRVPDHQVALDVLRLTGPLAVTSANLSGRPPVSSCHEVAALFGDVVSVLLCANDGLSGQASTVVALTGDDPIILRAGSTTKEQILEALPGVTSGPA